VLRRSTLVLAALTALVVPAHAQAQAPDLVITQTAPAAGIGSYLYFPFTVPPGVNRVAVKITRSSTETKVGAGLFDERGAQFNSPGFRGIYGEEINEFFVASDSASRAFVAGPIVPGTWTTVVPIFRAPTPTTITATMTLSFGPQGTPPPLEPVPEVVSTQPGWYRGDLHDHTTFSSDAFSSKSALDPGAFAQKSKDIGLDWVSLTDHNVTAQNDRLATPRPANFLTLAGEEVTNWFHGHSTAIGVQSGDFFDWRWRPGNLPIDAAHEGRVRGYLDKARAAGAYTSAAHPLGAHLAWQSFADAAIDPLALPDGLEVWNGPFQPDDEASLTVWDELLRSGRRVWANGGSDIHGLTNSTDLQIATPTTVTYAQALSRTAVVSALKTGRSYISSGPKGPELYFTAAGSQGQRTYTGGSIYGAATDTAQSLVVVRGGSGGELRVLRDGVVVQRTAITSDSQEVGFDQRIGPGGFLRVELRGEPTLVPNSPLGSDLGMRAMTNPIFLVNGPLPPGTQPEDAPIPGRPAPAPGSAPGRCAAPRGFASVGVRALRGGRVRFEAARALRRPYDVELFAQSQGGRVVANRRVARFTNRRGSFTWSGRTRGPLRVGTLLVRFRMRIPGVRSDVRRVALRRSRRGYAARGAVAAREGCGLLRVAKLHRGVFGGRSRVPGRLSVRVGAAARVTVTLVRGGRVVRRVASGPQRAGVLARRGIAARGLRPGRYHVRIVARSTNDRTARGSLGLERE